MDIHEIINRIYRMPEASADKVVKHLSKVTYPKGYHILEAGKTETNIFFIEKGIARAYIPVDGKEVTFWIGKEGSTIVSLKSYVNNQQGYESMELMENSVQYMSKAQMEKSIERTRKLMQEAAKKLEFIEAAQYRDELLKLEDLMKEKWG